VVGQLHQRGDGGVELEAVQVIVTLPDGLVKDAQRLPFFIIIAGRPRRCFMRGVQVSRVGRRVDRTWSLWTLILSVGAPQKVLLWATMSAPL